MECEKCKTEVDSQSKFCPKCGKEVKSDFSTNMDRTFRDCKRAWFMVGFHRGVCLTEKDEKSLKALENRLKKDDFLYEEYLEAIAYWQNKAKETDHDN